MANNFFASPPANSSNVNPNAGGLFALSQNTNATQNSTTTPSLFGNANPTPNPLQPQPTQSSIFGNTNANAGANTNANQNTTTNTGGLFGQQPQQPSTGGNIFGNTNNPTSTGNNLFGNAPAQVQGGLGNPLFGGPGPGPGPVTGSTSTNGGIMGGGIFGTNPSNQQQQGTAGTTSGNPLFGGSTNQGSQFITTTAKPPGTGFFNLNATSNNNTNPGTNTNTNTNTNSLFANSFLQPPQQSQATSNSLFSGNKTTTANPFAGSALGTSTLGTSALGGGQQGAFGNSLLNSRPNALTSTTGVGTGITGQQQLAEAQEQFIKISQRVETVYNAWHPSSKDCRFQYIFYNLVDPKQVNMYGRPPNATNDALWEKAVRENPDSTCLVPVIAIGFDDLRERANAQSAQSSSHLQKLTDLSTRLKSLLTEHSVSNASRLQRAHNTQTQLTQRLMRLVQHLHLLIPAVRSSSIRVEEEELRGRLEEMEEELRRGRVKGKLNEMWALLGAVGAFMERGRGDGQGGPGEWAVVDEEGLAQITQILAEQQAGLQHLTKILQKDQKDLAIIMGSGKAKGDDEYLANEGENMWSSTNTTLRSSSLR